MKKDLKGFTLVEMMITIGLFTVIMTIGIGAILGVNSTQRKTQGMRVAVDALSFIMEDMARSMRLGDYFYCDTSISPPTLIEVSNGNIQNTQDGDDCKSIVFEPYWDRQPVNPDNQIMYFIGEFNGRGVIYKKENTNPSFSSANLVAITPSEIDIDESKSGFYVTGSTANDGVQPRIKVILVGTVNIAGTQTEFNLQTTVTQRLLDIDSFN